MRKHRVKVQTGVAMIMVLVMIVIFSSLILAIVLSATKAIRTAHFYQDKTIALQIAEAGIHDVFYWLNYKGYHSGKLYPCTNAAFQYDTTRKYFQGSNHDGISSETWIATEPANYNPTDIPLARCVVTFTDNPGINEDTIESTGFYKGRTASIKVNVRGSNGQGNTEHNPGRALGDFYWDTHSETWIENMATWGIAEAFNKHAVYAQNVTGSPTIEGNVTTTSPKPPSLSGAKATWTQSGNIKPPLAIKDIFADAVPSTDMEDPSDPALLNTHPNTDIFYNKYLYLAEGDTINLTSGGPVAYTGSLGNRGGTIQYDSTSDSYIINGMNNQIYNILVKTHGSAGGNLQIANACISKHIKAYEKITITGDITTSNVAVLHVNSDNVSEKLNINSGVVIHGDLIVRGGDAIITTGNTLLQTLSINGGLLWEPGNLGGTLEIGNATIDASSSILKSVIAIVNTSNPARLTITGTPVTVTVGENQSSVFTVYSSGQTDIAVNATVSITFNSTPYLDGKTTILAFSETGSSSVSLGSASNAVNVEGLIYSYGGNGEGNITISNTNTQVTGVLIANKDVTLNAGSITYNGRPYLDNEPTVYKGFSGGRRKYQPVPGSWKVTW